MKKKFLTLALTASMVLGSAFSTFAATEEKEVYSTDAAYQLDGNLSTSQSVDNPLKGIKTDKITIEYSLTSSQALAAWNGVAQFYNTSGGVAHLGFWPQICLNDWNGNYAEFATKTIYADSLADGKEHTYKYVITSSSIQFYVDGTEVTAEALKGNSESCPDIETACKALLTFMTSAEKFSLGYGHTAADWWGELGSEASTINSLKISAAVEVEDESAAETGSTTVSSPQAGDEETGETTVSSPQAGDEEADTTTENNQGTGEENTSAPAAEDEAGVVSAEVVAEIAKSAVVEGAPEGAKLEVNAIAADSEDYSLAKKFVTDELKAKAWAVLDLKLVDAENAVVQPDGKVKITLPVFENIKDAKYVAVYRLDDSKFTHLSTSEVKDGKFTFETDHFSTYLFASVDNPATDSIVDGSETTTGDTAPIAGMMVAALAAVGAVVLVSTKKKNA